MRPRIALVDYGAGNLRSVAKALERSEMEPVVTSDPSVVRDADGVLLPGVGAFRNAVEALEKAGLADAIRNVTDHGRPYLGICFGLQLLFDEGEEHGITTGLGRLAGRVTRFPEKDVDGSPLLIPHIGWNEVRFEGDHPMLASLPASEVYYFVHSYRPEPTDDDIIVGRTDYGGSFAAAVARDNIFAVQFHPEKSQAAGRRLLDAYRRWLEASR
ncbi:MAG: imidazole glycerol phosphate synthase subunit HisH [Myxococcales bacterium]|nr:imidazole glycerol phosphate synthase subunit HisH [Myxococcales bacterium]HIK83571.1 imidazole glycerol phosphate synthase subunit HisH [Myxococcales bacterium]